MYQNYHKGSTEALLSFSVIMQNFKYLMAYEFKSQINFDKDEKKTKK